MLATTMLVIATTSSRSEIYSELNAFAQSICDSIPRDTLSRASVQAKVEANADVLAKLITGDPKLNNRAINDLYRQIPFMLPGKFTTPSECKFSLAKLLVSQARQADSYNSPIAQETEKSQSSLHDTVHRGVDLNLTPVRRYLDARDIPPPGGGAYGIVAFRYKATPASRAKLIMVCESFIAFFPPGETSGVPISNQMVTVWPVDNLELENAKDDNCDYLIDHYDLTAAESAIRDAKHQLVKFDGEGPYLIGWSPSSARGIPDKLVLVIDMSNDNDQATIDHRFLFWKNKIVEDPLLWRNGFSVDGVRTAIRNFADKYGKGLLDSIRLVGGR